MNALALDTNLLMLMCLGSASPNYIGNHKRISKFSASDFGFLAQLLSGFSKLIVTPYCLAELSNLLNISAKRTTDARVVAEYRNIVAHAEELAPLSAQVCAREDFPLFGLSDSAWLDILTDEVVFISTDSQLVNRAQAIGKKAEWFGPTG